MSRAWRGLVLLLSLIGAGLLSPDSGSASPGQPLTGFTLGKAYGWSSENRFPISWNPNPVGSPPVEYTLRRPDGEPIPGFPTLITEDPGVNMWVPGPGIYLFQAWNPGGPVSQVPIYFDDARPAPPLLHVPAWVAAGQMIPVHVSMPGGSLPVSGIQGFAVTLDSQGDGLPCDRLDRCETNELVLGGTAGDHFITLRPPPEGFSYVHAVAASYSGMESSAVVTARVGVDGTPPAVHLEGDPGGWSPNPVRVSAVATDALSGMAADGPNGPITALAVDDGPPLITPGDRATTTVGGDGVHRLDFYARDALGNSGDGSLPFAGPGTATIRIDGGDPAVRFAAPDPGDPERVEAIVGDPLSGPDPSRGSIAVRAVGSSTGFRPLPTATRRGHLVARWNSDDFPRGPYEFRATGFDLAGNSKTTSLGGDGEAFVLRNPVKPEARLAFGFGAGRLVYQRCSRADGSRRCHRTVVRSFAHRPPARTVPCCHGALVGGRLVGVGGAPLAGQTVEVIETFADGAHNDSRRTVLTSDADGRFSTRLAPGPSREITAEFPGTAHLTRAAGRQIRLRVRAAIGLRVSTAHVRVGGPPVVFSGRIAHPEVPIPDGGLPVQLQFRLPGMPWTEFRTVQSDALGGFRYPYSFSDDDSAGVRFQFRAAVGAAGGWPFAPATSRPVAVTG